MFDDNQFAQPADAGAAENNAARPGGYDRLPQLAGNADTLAG